MSFGVWASRPTGRPGKAGQDRAGWDRFFKGKGRERGYIPQLLFSVQCTMNETKAGRDFAFFLFRDLRFTNHEGFWPRRGSEDGLTDGVRRDR